MGTIHGAFPFLESEMVFLVMLRVDNGGSALVACRDIIQDPFLSDHVVLMDVVALSWPFRGKFLDVRRWSVMKSSILNYMCGDLMDEPTLTVDMLGGEGQTVPWPPGSTPSQPLVTEGREGELDKAPED